MVKIEIKCEGCMITHSVDRSKEIPRDVISMGCNWCPSCEDSADDYYEEWYNRSEGGESKESVPDNQLVMPFIIDEIKSKVVKHPATKKYNSDIYKRILNRTQ